MKRTMSSDRPLGALSDSISATNPYLYWSTSIRRTCSTVSCTAAISLSVYCRASSRRALLPNRDRRAEANGSAPPRSTARVWTRKSLSAASSPDCVGVNRSAIIMRKRALRIAPSGRGRSSRLLDSASASAIRSSSSISARSWKTRAPVCEAGSPKIAKPFLAKFPMRTIAAGQDVFEPVDGVHAMRRALAFSERMESFAR